MTVLQRGAAPVDPYSGMVGQSSASDSLSDLLVINVRRATATHQVHASGGEVWDATLNQTDLSKNANKCVKPSTLTETDDPSSIVTGFTCCNFCTLLATMLPACYSPVGVGSGSLARLSGR